jgi:hypothetical protein
MVVPMMEEECLTSLRDMGEVEEGDHALPLGTVVHEEVK